MKRAVRCIDACLVFVLTAALGAMLYAPAAWLIMAAPGSHALDRGHEPALWLNDDERGQDPAH